MMQTESFSFLPPIEFLDQSRIKWLVMCQSQKSTGNYIGAVVAKLHELGWAEIQSKGCFTI